MISELSIPIAILAATGVIGGFLAGLFGIGGGLVIVPALYFFLQSLHVEPTLAMAMAIQTSLLSIIPTSLSSLRAHNTLRNVDWSLVKLWAPWTITGVLVGSLLVAKVRSPGFTMMFGMLLLFVAIQKVFWPQSVNVTQANVPGWIHRACAAIIGFVSACAGVGGGATGVPAMLMMGVPIHRAIGSCAALGLAIALPGGITIFLMADASPDHLWGAVKLVYVPALILLAPLTILCAPIGAKLGKRLSAKLLTRLFAVVLVVVGLKMISTV